MSLNTKSENLGQINVVMKDRGDHLGETAAAERLRGRFLEVPDLEVKLGRPSYFSLRTPVEVVLFGEDVEIEELRAYSLEVARRLREVRGLVDVRSSLEAGHPELQVIPDTRRIASLGLQEDVVSATLRASVLGVVATRFKETDRQIDVRVRNLEEMRSSKRDIENLVVPGPSGLPLRLTQVAEVREARGPAEIHRLQQERAAIVSANLEDRSLGAAIADVEALLAEIPPHKGITSELGGQNREMQVSFRSLQFALSLAVFLVYLVMAATFESFVHPFIVLLSIPLALIGVVAGLLATGTTISVIVLIGTILLAGIVVNNAIVLIDYVNQLRRRGVEKLEAVVMAGHVRLRPILMTTLTTVLGLLPMAFSFGEGAELRAPLAITVLFGLSASTLLTLVVIPALYMVVPSRVVPAAARANEDGAEAP
jgi:HAE1 family hydrophobic/amphiphilic exporter-1